MRQPLNEHLLGRIEALGLTEVHKKYAHHFFLYQQGHCRSRAYFFAQVKARVLHTDIIPQRGIDGITLFGKDRLSPLQQLTGDAALV